MYMSSFEEDETIKMAAGKGALLFFILTGTQTSFLDLKYIFREFS